MKKKGFIGLSTLLLVLLLGLFTTSYASITSIDELKNFIYNVYAQNYTTGEIDSSRAETVSNFISAHSTDIQQIYNDMQSYTGYVIPAVLGNTVRNDNIRVMLTNNKFYSGGDGNYVQGINRSYNIRVTNGTISASNTSSLSGYSTTWHVYSSNVPVYVDTSYTTIRHEAGDYPTSYLDGNYTQPVFAFVEEPTTEHGNVYEFENVPVYEKPKQSDLLLGFLTVPNEITINDFRIDRYYYQGGDWQQKVITYNQNNPYIFRNLYYTDQNQKAYNYYYKQENLYKDNIYYIRWGDTTTEPYQWAYCIFYIKSDGTTISGGMIHNPSGDPIQDIINNGNENDDFWKNVYHEMFNVTSGEVKKILEDFKDNTNLGEVGTLSGELMMLNILTGEPTDFVISWDTVYTPNIANSGIKQLVPSGEINFSKLTMRLGNQYEAPTNREKILEIINIVRIILGYTVLVLLGANLWETIMRALGIGVGMYEDNEEEKERMNITIDENYDVNADTGEIIRHTRVIRNPKERHTTRFISKK